MPVDDELCGRVWTSLVAATVMDHPIFDCGVDRRLTTHLAELATARLPVHVLSSAGLLE